MNKRKAERRKSLEERYPASEPCSCAICTSYCTRPGWWTVEQAALALDAGYGNRMMLEIAPELTFGVLSPAFKGCEGCIATNQYSGNGCTFFRDNGCQLHGTGHQPLECRFCHHDRPGRGLQCHAALEKDWKTPRGQALVETWIKRFLSSGHAFPTRSLTGV